MNKPPEELTLDEQIKAKWERIAAEKEAAELARKQGENVIPFNDSIDPSGLSFDELLEKAFHQAGGAKFLYRIATEFPLEFFKVCAKNLTITDENGEKVTVIVNSLEGPKTIVASEHTQDPPLND